MSSPPDLHSAAVGPYKRGRGGGGGGEETSYNHAEREHELITELLTCPTVKPLGVAHMILALKTTLLARSPTIRTAPWLDRKWTLASRKWVWLVRVTVRVISAWLDWGCLASACTTPRW